MPKERKKSSHTCACACILVLCVRLTQSAHHTLPWLRWANDLFHILLWIFLYRFIIQISMHVFVCVCVGARFTHTHTHTVMYIREVLLYSWHKYFQLIPSHNVVYMILHTYTICSNGLFCLSEIFPITCYFGATEPWFPNSIDFGRVQMEVFDSTKSSIG